MALNMSWGDVARHGAAAFHRTLGTLIGLDNDALINERLGIARSSGTPRETLQTLSKVPLLAGLIRAQPGSRRRRSP
jgi:hypothetical protein